ncbi:MAG: FtsX-like permease family protein [Gemmataceae bacterium]|nr:FtsX-like permease family protein [Gemmataceae bacterium]
MYSLYRTLSFRYLSRRWFRALLIAASIALGVATLVATQALNGTMSRAADFAANPMTGVADLIVQSSGTMEAALATKLNAVPGVKSVQPRIFDNVRLPDYGDRSVLLMGLDLMNLKDVGDADKMGIKVSDGAELRYAAQKLKSAFGAPPPTIVGRELSKELNGDTFRVQKTKTGASFKLSRAGMIEANGDAAALAGFVILADLETAARALELTKGHVHRFDVVLERGADAKGARKKLEAALEGRATIRSLEEQNRATQSVMSGMQTGFTLCGLAALVVGMFLVFNALSVTVAERRHEIGILLAVGATRSQVLWLFAGEAFLLGLLGSLLGLPIGMGLAHLGLQPIQASLSEIFYAMDAQQVEITFGVVGSAGLLGIATAVMASLIPAFQASRENPASAVRRVAKAPTATRLIVQVAASATLIIVGAAMIATRAWLPARLGSYGGIMFVLVGTLVASPFLAALFARLIQPFIRRFLGIEWRLAADNLVRSPGRTGLVIGALAAGVSLVIQTAGVIRSNRLGILDWVDHSIGADLVVTSGSPVGSSGQSQAMSWELGQELEAIPNVEAALPVRFRQVPFADTNIMILTSDAGRAYGMEKSRVSKGAEVELYRKIDEQSRAAIASDNMLALHGLRVGDTVRLPSPKGEIELTIIGHMPDYSWTHGTLVMNGREYREIWQDDRVDVFDVYVKTGGDRLATSEIAKEAIISRLGPQNALHALTKPELKDRIQGMIERLYGIAYSQQIVVMLVAGLGVVTALLISVLQRRREMGMLRAIGASRLQVIRSVLAEACLMGIIGTLIGLAVGIPLEWYVINVAILEETGFLFPVYVPWAEAGIVAVAALLTATLAGLGPAIYAVRQRIPDAIAYE